MSGYLDNYGVADARKEKRTKIILYTVLALAVAGGALYFLFRDFREEARIKEFVELLQKQDYKPAYALWGCTDQKPCRDYAFDKFMEDWGPQARPLEVGGKKSCHGGIIQSMRVKGQEVNLFVDRSTLSVGFAPWPVCAPRVRL